MTHEMGHFFGLLHIWGDEDHDCSDSDEVEDTPNQEGPYLGCPSGIQTSCGVNNMYQNFMDLTDDRCLAAFTKGQSMRMQASIDAYYPGLLKDVLCQAEIQPFEKWYDELVWADDQHSGQYVVYHPSGTGGKINVEVFSVDGRLIEQAEWEGNQSFLLNLNSVASGIYLVRISNGQNEAVRKVVSYR